MALAMSATTHHHPGFNNAAPGASHGESTPRLLNIVTPVPPQDLLIEALEFTWENTAFVASITKDAKRKEALVTISCCIGWLPYSAENNQLRAQALNFFHDQITGLTGKFSVSTEGKVRFSQKTRVSNLGSREAIIGMLTICLLQAQPYLKTAQGLLLSV